MWPAFPIARAVAILLAGAMLSLAGGGAAAAAPVEPEAHTLLDVPYLPQTPELCGGAAVAMVLRYWGERNVFPEDFGSLVAPGDGGILTAALTAAVRDRRWLARVVPAARDTARARIQSEIDRGRPLIALIEVAPRTYHYVVIVGLTDGDVVLHDPARAPFRVLRWAEFERAWEATGRWMMLVLPPVGFRPDGDDGVARTAPPSSGVEVRDAGTPCGALVGRGVQLALTGDRGQAEQALVAATGLCPNEAAAWRELAGLRFSESRWSEARDLALSAVRLEPDDTYAWQVVAASRYLMGDAMGALDAWNHAGEPRMDTIGIHGADRTRQPVVARAAGWQPRQVLTSDAFALALRRLRELPIASDARMRYEPTGGGLARVEIFLDERQTLPGGWWDVAVHGARALLLDQLQIDVAGPLGAGETASVAWRWAAARPSLAVGLALPSPPGLPGVVSLSGLWERQSYDAMPASGAAVVRGTRRRLGAHVADWSASWLRWQTGAALDRLSDDDDRAEDHFDARDHLAVDGSVDVRLGNRLALAVSGGWWLPFAGGKRFSAGGLLAAGRSTDDAARPAWSGVTEVAVTSRSAPLALWHGAGTGQGRSGLLRAHPLVSDGVVTGPVFGRTVARGSLEYARPVARALGGALSIAGFVDAARAWRRLRGLETSPLYVDAGVGVRVRGTGPGRELRIDIARGLLGGGTAISADWRRTWPW